MPTNAGSYTVIGTINNANYQGSATNTLVIGQASGAVTLGSLSQTYNGTAKAATASTTPSGLTVNLTYNGSANAPTNAGSYTVIGTINDANYQGGATNTLVINKAILTYTANAASMTYGSAVPGLSGSVSGFVGTDNQGNATTGALTFTTTATSSSGVGGYAINGAGLTANNGNYTFVQGAGNATALTINALPVNLTGTRSYDGTTTVAAGILSVANKVGGDNVTVVSGSGTLAGANVGSEAIMSLGTLALGGTAAGNYTLVGASGSVNITVSALALTVTNLLAVDKVYDGTTNATLDATDAGLTGVLNGDDVTLVSSNAVAYFADKNADTNKPVTVTGLALGGAAAANYTLTDPTNVTANIPPRPNADAPHEIFLTMEDIPVVMTQWWSAIISAKQMSGYYFDGMNERGFQKDLSVSFPASRVRHGPPSRAGPLGRASQSDPAPGPAFLRCTHENIRADGPRVQLHLLSHGIPCAPAVSPLVGKAGDAMGRSDRLRCPGT